MILHHVVLEEYGDAAKPLIREFKHMCGGRPSSFITWLVQTRKLKENTTGELEYSAPIGTHRGEWTIKSKDYTVVIGDDQSPDVDFFVILIEKRSAPVEPLSVVG